MRRKILKAGLALPVLAQLALPRSVHADAALNGYTRSQAQRYYPGCHKTTACTLHFVPNGGTSPGGLKALNLNRLSACKLRFSDLHPM